MIPEQTLQRTFLLILFLESKYGAISHHKKAHIDTIIGVDFLAKLSYGNSHWINYLRLVDTSTPQHLKKDKLIAVQMNKSKSWKLKLKLN